MAIVIALAAILGAPLFCVIASSALSGFHSQGVDLTSVAINIYQLTDTQMLPTIPLFTLAGYIMSESNAPHRLIRLSRAVLGWIPGGLSIVALVACAMFTAFTGASGVTIIALGGLLYPALISEGYPEKFALGLVTTAGALGLLFPPSLPPILYGVISKVSVEDLYRAGMLPGLLMVVLLSMYSVVVSKRANVPTTRFQFKEVFLAAREAIWEIPLPFVVLGGIYSGKFAVADAAVVTAMYALVVETLVYREIGLKKLASIFRETVVLVGGVLVIVSVSMASTNYMMDAQVPVKIANFTLKYISSPLTFLIVMNIFLLLVGCLLDIFSHIVIVLPLLLPLAQNYGINPVHLGIIFLANLQIGYCVPPFGMDLFISSYRFNKPILLIFRSTIPFSLLLLLTVFIITYWPELSLFLLKFK
jgi:tripartite ATP-independent transporter DctM subunit